MMRKLLPIVALLLCSVPAGASYAFVSGGSSTASYGCTTTTASSCTMTPSPALTQGNFITIGIRESSSATINTPSDSAGDQFLCGTQFTGGTSTTAVRLCWAYVGASVTTVTCSDNLVTTHNLWCTLQQYSGAPTGCLSTIADGAQKTGSTNAGTSVTSASYTSTATDLLVAVVGIGTNEAISAGAVFGTTGTLRTTTSATNRVGYEDRLNIAAGSGTAAMSGGTSTDWDIIFQGFLPTCPSSSCTPTLALTGVGSC